MEEIKKIWINRKPDEHYPEFYDETTVGLCKMGLRRVEELGEKLRQEKFESIEPEERERQIRLILGMYRYFMVDYRAGERWMNREAWIAEQKKADEDKDAFVENYETNFYPDCPSCGKQMSLEYKHLRHRQPDWTEHIFLVFHCDDCSEFRRFWWDHVEEVVNGPYCPDCNSEDMDIEYIDNKKVGSYRKSTCLVCGWVEEDKENALPPRRKITKEEKALYCLDEERGKKFLEEKHNLDSMKRFMDDWRFEAEEEEVRKAVAAMDRLKVVDLQNLLYPVVSKAGFSEMVFGRPESGKHLTLSFTCLDVIDRPEYDSVKKLKKAIIHALKNTNWRLSGEISYRLGYLEGQFKGFDKDEDLRKIIKKGRYT